ncbi:MAG: site-specific DNA-methyltransferase [Candidatus Manganitrophus sp. SB1]|nr:site-specific DNA-methyltransferase [Candidatus Manganitrophus morganii]
MPTLNWIGKEAVVNHHRHVPFHLLKDVPDLACGKPGDGNLIVQGDNLVALKALLPYYAGQVKCIYIDPPYNTGNEGWVYNDNVNSPVIREWLGRTVGKEGETLDRHDRWLCMMYPRLALLRQFLCEDGAIFISIDDNESPNLIQICDEIFGIQNRVLQGVWIKRVSPANDAKYFSSDHEFIVIYAKHKDLWRPQKLTRTEKQLENYRNPDNDPRGPWNSVTYTCNKSADERPNLYHGITNPNTGKVIWPKKTAVWKYDAARHRENELSGLVWWGAGGTARMPRLKRFLHEMGDVVPRSFFHYDDTGHTQEARSELLEVLPDCPFTTPKTSRLIRRIIELATNPGDLVLDSFAGSGTTGHAVLSLNHLALNEGPRRFILVEMEKKIASEVTAERVRRVTEGYTNAKGERVEGLGGGFRYCELGEPLFDENGKIRETVGFADLARHVYFSETGEPLPRERVNKSPFLGACRGVGIYLLYNGILGDQSANGGNVLTRAVLAQLPPFDGQKVIYCAGCLLGRDRLQAERIIIRQTPYEIKVS